MEKKVLEDYNYHLNKEMMKQYADFSSAKKLVDLITQIPNFGIVLT